MNKGENHYGHWEQGKRTKWYETREAAENQLAAQTASITQPEIDYKRLVHELQVQKIELVMQNEALAAALLFEQAKHSSDAVSYVSTYC